MGLLVAALLFASGDLWPTVTVGFTFRLSQLLALAALAMLVPTLLRQGVVLGGYMIPAAGWIAFSLVVFPLSLYQARSIGYTLWLITNILTIFAFVQAFRFAADVSVLLRAYIYGFILLAAFGMMQLAAGVLGIDLLIQEWWIDDTLPRINGLSYEPSYYATYLLPGWVTAAYLVEKQTDLVNRFTLKLALMTTSLALLLATSRLGWMLMALWVAFRSLTWLLRLLLGTQILRRRIGVIGVAGIATGLFGISPVGLAVAKYIGAALSAVSFLLNGLGILGASSHSFSDRFQGALMTWNAFLNHPWVGTGLGALPVEIAKFRHAPVQTLADAKANEGMSTALELIASVGIIGCLFVGAFAVMVVLKWRRAFMVSSGQKQTVLLGVGWGIIWLLLALQFNQNFLRIYVWMDVAVMLALAHILSRRANGATEPS